MYFRGLLLAALVVASVASVKAQDALINANSAAEAQIASLPGLAPLASTIVAKRPYASPMALDAVLAEGKIASDQRKLLYTRLWVPMNLNTATLQDIMLIPGMSRRMADEFREYKPYRSIGQFRHEIGKYVSKEEVARLERYVLVPPR